MIWQENVYCIVMATNLFEHARVCLHDNCFVVMITILNQQQQLEKYWHNQHGRYGNTEVWLEHSDLLCDFNIRTFRVRRV